MWVREELVKRCGLCLGLYVFLNEPVMMIPSQCWTYLLLDRYTGTAPVAVATTALQDAIRSAVYNPDGDLAGTFVLWCAAAEIAANARMGFVSR